MTSPVLLILASGQGRRWRAAGGALHKLQADFGGLPLLDATVVAARASGLPWHVERAAHAGMGDALAAAVRARRDAPGWLILPGDMPLVRPATLQAVAGALRAGAAAAQPVFQGQRGHPVGFAAGAGPALTALSGDEGARSVLARLRSLDQVVDLPVEDEGVLADVDIPADLQRALALREQRLRSGG